MLVNFSVRNWRTIGEEITLSMQATREQQHGERLTKINKFGIRLLPSALLFGANASGKTSLIQAFDFMRSFVIKWDPMYLAQNYEPNRVIAGMAEEVGMFKVELYLEDLLFTYQFKCTNNEVIEERLVQSNSSSDYILFDRQGGRCTFNETIYSESERNRYQIIFQGTDQARLLLNNLNEQKVTTFKTVYNWFKYGLQIIYPDSYYSRETMLNSEEILELFNVLLPHVDTGIKKVEKQDISQAEAGLTDKALEELLGKFQFGEGESVVVEGVHNFTLIEADDIKKPRFYKLMTVHQRGDEEIRFSMTDESQGTKRLLDLIPALCQRSKTNHVTYVIDEINRSLHPNLTSHLFRSFHSGCGGGCQDQVIATTHDLLLMRQDLFRRDEMWFLERSNRGSRLVSFAEFLETKKDKDLLRSYLAGRMGGLPDLIESSFCKDV